MSFLRAIHPFDHFPFDVEADELPDTPVPRKAIAFYPEGNSQNREPITADYAARYVSRLTMLVEDPSLFTDRDEVTVGGKRYEIDGDPAEGDWRRGPFAGLNRMFGGEIHLKRVG